MWTETITYEGDSWREEEMVSTVHYPEDSWLDSHTTWTWTWERDEFEIQSDGACDVWGLLERGLRSQYIENECGKDIVRTLVQDWGEERLQESSTTWYSQELKSSRTHRRWSYDERGYPVALQHTEDEAEPEWIELSWDCP